MTHPTGRLLLVPNTLDFGIVRTDGQLPLDDTLPLGTIRAAARLGHWVAENAKTTRVFLKRVDAIVPLARPLQEISITELPRPPKGRASATAPDLAPMLDPARSGDDIGLISEAGLPAVADPGAALVQAAHVAGIQVVSLAGSSSILLALAASGLNGQSFAFVGYLPVEAAERTGRIRELEALSRRIGQTQLMIETPYRNEAILGALLSHLADTTRLSVSCALTLPEGFTRTDTVARWKASPARLPSDRPAIFALLAT
jgi:16S rRNA (cytidine1402-2'-O)-methyltransferase